MRDTVGMEQIGIPSVGLIHVPFERLARMQARHLGMTNAPLLIYPQDLPSRDPADVVAAKAEQVAGGLRQFLLGELAGTRS